MISAEFVDSVERNRYILKAAINGFQDITTWRPINPIDISYVLMIAEFLRDRSNRIPVITWDRNEFKDLLDRIKESK